MEVNGYEIFRCGNLRGAEIDGADLSGANLYLADLEEVKRRGTDLSKATLIGANLPAADLSGAEADQYIIWPGGFDPEAAGVTIE